jgi:hypothetical protein
MNTHLAIIVVAATLLIGSAEGLAPVACKDTTAKTHGRHFSAKCGGGGGGGTPPATPTPLTPCSNSVHCMSHGTASGYTQTGCSCSCYVQYAGTKCAVCSGTRINYPTCSLPVACANSYCNNHGTASGWTHSGCSCSCSSAYEGTRCSTCSGTRLNYPTCSLPVACASTY